MLDRPAVELKLMKEMPDEHDTMMYAQYCDRVSHA
jgi:hypothetical protein